MGNFKPYAREHARQQCRRRDRRAVLKASVGQGGENLPTDLKLISIALADAGLLSSATPPHLIKREVVRAIQHVSRTIADPDLSGNPTIRIDPSDTTERMVRRAFAEMRFPTSHRLIAESASPRGARAIIARGVELAHQKIMSDDAYDDGARGGRRAHLPTLTAVAFQTNRRLIDVLTQTDIHAIDVLIAKSIRFDGKPGFVDVRDFFGAFTSKMPHKSKALADKVKRHLCRKSRRRFIKLLEGVPPNEGDFENEAS